MKSVIFYMIYCTRAWFTRVKDSFIADFKKNVLKPSAHSPQIGIIENYRIKLARNREVLNAAHFGAGTRLRKKTVTIGETARRSSIKSKYGVLLFNLVSWLKPEMIIELGTALGISTMYLAKGNPDARVITLEGNSRLSDLAGKYFSEYNLNNITCINKPFDEVLPALMSHAPRNILVFIDGNHTYEDTIRYFNLSEMSVKTVTLVFDDINWSAEMRRAWKEIEKSTGTGTTIDLFQMGIVFQGMRKMNITLWY